MFIVAIAWMYVVLMMAVAEAVAPNGSLLGAGITFVLYGVLPLSVVVYILGTPGRRRARQAAERGSAEAPDGGGEAASGAVAPKGKEP